MSVLRTATKYSALWDGIKFYYQHDFERSDTNLGSLNATGKDNIFTRDEQTYFQANTSTTSCSITMTSATSTEFSADYLAIGWHTLYTTSATVSFQYTPSGGSPTNIVDDFTLSNDDTYIIEFDTVTGVVFTLTLTYASGQRPKIGMCHWGKLTEIDHCASNFDPLELTIKDNLQITERGYLNKIDTLYTERKASLQFSDLDSDAYDDLVDWHTTVRNAPFFMCWDYSLHSTDACIMRSNDGTLTAPYNNDGTRNCSLELVGKL